MGQLSILHRLTNIIMNSFVLFSAILALAYATEDPFVGSWKEDQYQRQNLNDYLYARGLNWFKRVYVTNANFELTMNIAMRAIPTLSPERRDLNTKIINSMLWLTTLLAQTSIWDNLVDQERLLLK